MENTELATKEQTNLASPISAQVVAEGLGKEDILVPKLLMMQAMSKYVVEDKAELGSIVKSTDATTLAKKTESVEFIPLTVLKNYLLMEKSGDKFEYRGESKLPFNKENEWVSEGKTMRQFQNLTFYVLLTSDIAKDAETKKVYAATGDLPENSSMLIPHAVSFRSTSYKYGKILATHFYDMAYFNAPAYSKKFKFTPGKVSNDKGTWYVLEPSASGKTTPEQMEACKKWTEILLGSNVKIDDTDEDVA